MPQVDGLSFITSQTKKVIFMNEVKSTHLKHDTSKKILFKILGRRELEKP